MRLESVVFAIAALSVTAVNLPAQQSQPSNRGPGGTRGTQIQPGESCPPGTTEIRPRNCLGPEAPAPSILDYRPKSTLVTPAHLVKTAKFPAIDYHGHPQGLLGSDEGLATPRRVARQPQRSDDGRRRQHVGRAASEGDGA